MTKCFFLFEKCIYSKRSNTADYTLLYYYFFNGNHYEDRVSKTQNHILKIISKAWKSKLNFKRNVLELRVNPAL